MPDGERILFCERHQIKKGRTQVTLCQTRMDYFRMWDRRAGFPSDRKQDREARKFRTVQRLMAGGPGSELKRIIKGWQRRLPWFNLSPNKSCGCASTARMMDRWGPDKCEKNMDVILDRLENEAKRRKLSVPFRRTIARLVVRKAIRRARKNRKGPTNGHSD